MATDKRLHLPYLLQADLREDYLPTIGTQLWQPLYLSQRDGLDSFGLFSSLLEPAAAARALTHDSWDLHIGDGLPGFSTSYQADAESHTYHRFGGWEGIRPIVVARFFHGAFPHYLEICEEFRHYHDLADDTARGRLLAFDRSGYEIEVARIAPASAEVRLGYLKQFQAGLGLAVGIYIDSVRYSNIPLADVPAASREVVVATAQYRYRLNVVECDHTDEYATFSRLLLKVVLPPPPLEQAGIWPFSAADRASQPEVSFIIDTDKDGKTVEYTSNPDKLANYFGANPDAPHYLTPVYFRREVLGKYYADPDRYTVSDGDLQCLGLWSCRIDNNHPTHVVVFLGDLGRDLPPDERLHWRQFNVAPEGGVSDTTFKRGFLAQWTDPEAPDLVFRQEYELLGTAWATAMGWPLFLPAPKGEEHLIRTIRVPVNNSQAELDAQVLTLAKLLVDSLNEAALEARGGPADKGDKGITKLERFLATTGYEHTDSLISYLRDLQSLRSSGAAHLKGAKYERILARLGADSRDRALLVRRLLEQATVLLSSLGQHYCPGYRPVRSA